MTAVRACVVAVLTAVLAACSTEGAADWELDGEPVDEEMFAMVPGPEHCDWTSATFLHMGWPPGTANEGRRLYVRDPDGVVTREFAEALDLEADLPEDAEPSGFRNTDGLELWFADGDDGRTAYVVDPDGNVEAWPISDPEVACA